ncbi:hypothetical protein GCM10028796_58160 [Ramlibacter monticola]
MNLMRFSSIFQLPAVPQQPAAPLRDAVPKEEALADRTVQVVQAGPVQELPDDLDARVRMIGEW